MERPISKAQTMEESGIMIENIDQNKRHGNLKNANTSKRVILFQAKIKLPSYFPHLGTRENHQLICNHSENIAHKNHFIFFKKKNLLALAMQPTGY